MCTFYFKGAKILRLLPQWREESLNAPAETVDPEDVNLKYTEDFFKTNLDTLFFLEAVEEWDVSFLSDLCWELHVLSTDQTFTLWHKLSS